tara:strand:- start:1356 stop:1535 length:180 start_codon:yes stop_codon:yes gene_type:complete
MYIKAYELAPLDIQDAKTMLSDLISLNFTHVDKVKVRLLPSLPGVRVKNVESSALKRID